MDSQRVPSLPSVALAAGCKLLLAVVGLPLETSTWVQLLQALELLELARLLLELLAVLELDEEELLVCTTGASWL